MSLVMKIQIKTTLTRMAKIEKNTISRVDEAVGQLVHNNTAGRDVKWYNHLGNLWVMDAFFILIMMMTHAKTHQIYKYL